jgi:hypothetical protein
MTDFFKLFIAFCGSIIVKLDALRFDFFGYSVSYVGLLVVFLVVGFVVNVFWKGAKS